MGRTQFFAISCARRFAENPLVLNAPNIRFYAGAPLVTSTGDRVGTVCIVDDRPRELEAQSLNVLINFAEVVVRELEKESARVRHLPLASASLHCPCPAELC